MREKKQITRRSQRLNESVLSNLGTTGRVSVNRVSSDLASMMAARVNMVERTPVNKEHRDHWSDCGQVFFTGGAGYGLTDQLQSIPLGFESDILEAFRTGNMPDYLKPIQRQALSSILEYRGEVEADGTTAQVKRPSAVRSRPARAIKRRAAVIRHAAQRKRATIH